MTRLKPVLPVFCIAIALLISGCTPDGAKAVAREVYGLELSDTQAKAVAEHHAQPKASPAPQGQLVSTAPRSVEQMIRDKWAGTGQADRAVRVARCESNLNPRAKNSRSSASGVFQLIRAHWAGRYDPFNAQANIDGAFRLWKSSGWRPWVCKG